MLLSHALIDSSLACHAHRYTRTPKHTYTSQLVCAFLKLLVYEALSFAQVHARTGTRGNTRTHVHRMHTQIDLFPLYSSRPHKLVA